MQPLTFQPLLKRIRWGGRRLPEFLGRPHPSPDPVGEAWVLSDVDGTASRVTNGPFAGATLRDLLARDPARVLGPAKAPHGRFPLLLKFIDARQELSVQVHPNDEQAHARTPGANGKTEAWVILDADPARSRIYAGFRNGTTAEAFRRAMESKTVPDTLHAFTPKPGDCVFLDAGTVHAIGAHVLLFEVQQTCDITYRLYDWDRVDAKTGRPRDLHVDDGLACTDFGRGPSGPVAAYLEAEHPARRERLVGPDCKYFTLHRVAGSRPFPVGAAGHCRVLVVTDGRGALVHGRTETPLGTGSVVLLPAEVGAAEVRPDGPLTALECGLPEC